MVSISPTSTGTTISSGDGSGTHSAILNVIQTISYFNLLESVIARNNKKQKDKPEPISKDIAKDGDESSIKPTEAAEPIDVVWEKEPQIQLPEKVQKRLQPSDPGMLAEKVPEPPIDPYGIAIADKEDLRVKIRIGEYFVEDRYPNLPERLEALPAVKQESLAAAMVGGLPAEPVSIEVINDLDKSFAFEADSRQNRGWEANQGSLHVSSVAMREELERQNSPGAVKIRRTMEEAFGDKEPHVYPGSQYDVYSGYDSVIVVGPKGLVKDVVELDKLGEAGIEANQILKNEEAREAIADYRIFSTASIHRNQQRELTP